MGRFKLLALVMTLGVWGADTQGAPPQEGGRTTASRPDPPVPPARYVDAVVKLCREGKAAVAAPYLQAADDYADMLTVEERATLDQYRTMVVGQAAPAAPGSIPSSAPTPSAAQSPTAAPTDSAVMPVSTPAAAPVAPMGGRGTEPDNKQAARWMLSSARQDIQLGRYDEAQAKLDQVRAMNVKWTLFDDTPNKVADALGKARPKAAAASSTTTNGIAFAKKDKAEAKELLKNARAALSREEYAQAESIALEVGSWGLHFSMLEDSPEKVASASRALRRRDAMRKAGPKAQPNEELYALQVQEARQMLSKGDLDGAEAKASQAQRLGVVPPITVDRAESVLADVAAARARGPAVAAVSPADVHVQRVQDVPAAAAVPAAVAPANAPASEPAPVLSPEATPAPALEPAAPVGAEPAPVPLEAPAAAPEAEAPAMPAENPLEAPVSVASTSPLDAARGLLTSGNYPAARQAATEVKQAHPAVAAEAEDVIAQINHAEQTAALALYEAALSSLRRGEYDRSRALLHELSAGQLDESMNQRVSDLLAKLPQDGEPGKATIGALEDVEAVKAQKLNAEVGTRVAEARRLLETDPDKAISLLEQTAAQVKAAGMPETVTRTMSRRVEVAIELAKKDKVTFDAKMKDKAFRAEIEHKRLRILEADAAKQAKLKELLDKAHEADLAGNYVESEKLYKMAVEIDPNEIAAVAGAQVARTKRYYERDKEIRTAKEDGVVTALQDVDRTMIFSPELQRNNIEYDKGFAQLTMNRRELARRLQPPKSAKAKLIEQKLNEPITLSADKQTLGETLDYIANFTGLNIVPDSSALAEEGLTLSSPVTLKLNGVKLKQALTYLLQPLHLTYTVDDEVLLITSPQASKTKTVVKIYNVADLVMPPENRQTPTTTPAPLGNVAGGMVVDPTTGTTTMSSPTLGALGAPAASGGMTGLAASPAGNQPTVSYGAPPKIDFEPLINLIKSSIAPGTWSHDHEPADMSASGVYGQGAAFGAAGGLDAGADQAIGTITPFFLNISLIIRHTAEVHDEIVDLLRQLRRLQDLQVSVEVRFVTVSDSFFEQIGVDFDFAIQSDTIGRKSTLAAPVAGAGNLFDATTTGGGGGGTAGTAGTAGIANPYIFNPIRDHALPSQEPVVVGTGGATNSIVNPNFSPNLAIPFIQDSFSAIAPFNATPNVGGSIGLAFLSDLEVYLFLQAAQGDTRNNLVQAPKVTTFNGANATISNFRSIFYVATLIPIVGAGSVAFQPGIAQLPDGVIFNVTPVVSADRRYVRMTLSPFFQTFEGFQTFTIPAAVGGGGLGGQASTINAQVQLPNTTVTNILTTVTVPDGGTVLLGGVKRLREQRIEFGVPVLSKTPMINRLFRNIGIGRTTDSLMLMVTPRIIILEEEEEKLGIPAVNTTF